MIYVCNDRYVPDFHNECLFSCLCYYAFLDGKGTLISWEVNGINES